MKPRLSVLDRRFKYRRSEQTDVAETFRRARRRTALLERIEKRKRPAPTEPKASLRASAEVVQLKKAHGGT